MTQLVWNILLEVFLYVIVLEWVDILMLTILNQRHLMQH